MSMFRSLQSNVATVSLFHNDKVPLSNKLYELLAGAYDKQTENKFIFDYANGVMPIYDQYQTLSQMASNDSNNTHIFNTAFRLGGGQEKANTGGIRVIDILTYNKFFEAYQQAIKGNAEVDASAIFQAPFVVDWDQNKFAGDVNSLQQLLAKYDLK